MTSPLLVFKHTHSRAHVHLHTHSPTTH